MVQTLAQEEEMEDGRGQSACRLHCESFAFIAHPLLRACQPEDHIRWWAGKQYDCTVQNHWERRGGAGDSSNRLMYAGVPVLLGVH